MVSLGIKSRSLLSIHKVCSSVLPRPCGTEVRDAFPILWSPDPVPVLFPHHSTQVPSVFFSVMRLLDLSLLSSWSVSPRDRDCLTGHTSLMVSFIPKISLGEMMSYLPIAGGHITMAERYVSKGFSFVLGWNYWYNWTIVLPAELRSV